MHQAFDYGISTMELLLSGRTMGTEFLEWNLLSGRTMVFAGHERCSCGLGCSGCAMRWLSGIGGEMELPRVVLCIRRLTYGISINGMCYSVGGLCCTESLACACCYSVGGLWLLPGICDASCGRGTPAAGCYALALGQGIQMELQNVDTVAT